jgi:hypothetical protein
MWHVRLNVPFARKVVSRKNEFFCVVCETLSFQPTTQKMSVLTETWSPHIKYRDVRAKF